MSTSLYLAGIGSWLPPAMTVAEAEAAGLCRRRALWRTEFESVRVSQGDSGPEMAARAARRALRQTGSASTEVGLVLHAAVYYQGHDAWASASYVQRESIGGTCLAVEVRQMSNGGMAALDVAARSLRGDRAARQVLVTTGDRFALPGFDRWHSDAGTVYGDGGTAVVLSHDEGFARLRSLVTHANPELERMHRGDDPFTAAPLSVRQPLDLEPPRRDYTASVSLDTVLGQIDAGQREAFKRALSEADVSQEEVDWFVLPHLGRPRLNAHFIDPLGLDPERTTWPWGRDVGHLGAGDQFAGLDHLLASGALRPGQLCLLAGVGAGFTWSCAVVEVLRRPEPVGAAR